MDESDGNLSPLTFVLIVVSVIASIVFLVIFLPLILMDMSEEERREHMDEWTKESIKRDTEWNSRFLTLDDCTEMILQLTEKRFHDNTFKQEAWDHYRETCS